MKKSFIIPAIVGISCLIGSGFTVIHEAGIADWTGSPVDGGPGSGGQCTSSGCHSGGATIPTLAMTASPAFGGSGTALTYAPGTTYNITITPSNASGGTYTRWGFNCEIINSQSATTSAVAMFGTFGAAVTSNCMIWTASQTTPYPPCASHNQASTTPWTFSWTAPASGTGYLYADVLGGTNSDNQNGCNVSIPYCYTLTPHSATGIATHNEANLTVFPNPATDNVSINFGTITGSKAIQLVDITGKLVLEKNTSDAAAQLDLTSISKGTYFVKVLDETKNVVAVKMIMVSK